MPMLDVGFISMDPMVADKFEVIRRQEAVSASGRSAPIEVNLGRKWGTVAVVDPADLVRRDDGEMAPRSISIVTRNQLIGVAAGYKPDVIVWRGARYTVTDCVPHPQFGRGHYQIKALSMNATDKAL